METRKLIKFGGSSHIIAIPNAWIKKNSLGKGDTIYIEENGNNELILHPSIKEQKQAEYVLLGIVVLNIIITIIIFIFVL